MQAQKNIILLFFKLNLNNTKYKKRKKIPSGTECCNSKINLTITMQDENRPFQFKAFLLHLIFWINLQKTSHYRKSNIV